VQGFNHPKAIPRGIMPMFKEIKFHVLQQNLKKSKKKKTAWQNLDGTWHKGKGPRHKCPAGNLLPHCKASREAGDQQKLS
jgi:hypothetical protein